MLIDVIKLVFSTNLVVAAFGQYINTPENYPSRIVFDENDSYDYSPVESSASYNDYTQSALLLQRQKDLDKANSNVNIKANENSDHSQRMQAVKSISKGQALSNSNLGTDQRLNFQAVKMRENPNDRLISPTGGGGTRVQPHYTERPVNDMHQNTADPQHDAKEGPTFTSPLSTSITTIGLDLLKVLDSPDSGNTAISPFSISMALGLLQQGASGETQRQISNLMRLHPDQSLIQFRDLINKLRKRTSRNILSLATTLFVDFGFAIDPQYKHVARENFASEVEAVDFKNSVQSSNHINNWIRTRTNDKIKELITPDALGPATQLLIANAIFFKGIWNSTFNKEMTIRKPFSLANGAFKETMFMQQLGKFQTGFNAQLNAQYLVLHFEGFQYAMVFIVPQQQTVSNLLANIKYQDLLNITASPLRDSSISIPKFDLKVDTDLTNALMRLGVVDLFTGKSSLQALSSPGGSPRVSGVLHGAALSIDEQGGKAAAATAVAINTLSLADWHDDFHFRADRPFLLLLWDIETALPLIVAKITDPTLPK